MLTASISFTLSSPEAEVTPLGIQAADSCAAAKNVRGRTECSGGVFRRRQHARKPLLTSADTTPGLFWQMLQTTSAGQFIDPAFDEQLDDQFQ
jgi:hypothetical protein